MRRDQPKPLPLKYKQVTKKDDQGKYETVLFQVFDEDFYLLGTWTHDDQEPTEAIKTAIKNIKK